MIFNIQRYSTHDGSGIRTVIFYKGCPLSCLWCCNPESQSFGPSLLYKKSLCKDFRECLASSSVTLDENGTLYFDRTEGSDFTSLENACPSRALTVCGENRSVGEILEEVEKDISFYQNSGGGVTLSGGEPLSQGEEIEELLAALHAKGVDVAIETSLHVQWEKIERVLVFTGCFLADLKHTDAGKFLAYTGGDASIVLENLERLSRVHGNLVIRVPVIPGFNNTLPEMQAIIDFASSLPGVNEMHFLPYHNLGAEKYRMMGLEYAFDGQAGILTGEIEAYMSYARSKGLKVLKDG
jgi:pyruvate formate lyase activating enzyme